jgi:hypothetical protein
MSTLVAVDGVVYDLETSREAPDSVSPMVGEAAPDDEAVRGEAERSSESRTDGPGE